MITDSFEITDRPARHYHSTHGSTLAVIETAQTGKAVRMPDVKALRRTVINARGYVERKRLDLQVRQSGLLIWCEPKSPAKALRSA